VAQIQDDQMTHSTQPKTDETHYLETELRLALEEIAHLNKALAEANMKLAILLPRKITLADPKNSNPNSAMDLLSEISPLLTTMANYSDLLASQSVGQLGSLQLRFLERINHSLEQVQQVLADYKNQYDPSTNQIEDKSNLCSLSEIIQEIISQKSELLQTKQLALQLLLPSSLPEIMGTNEEISKIVDAFLTNAIEITPPQEIICVSSALEKMDQIDLEVLSIFDSGPGIPNELLPTLFSIQGEQTISGCSLSRSQLMSLKQLVQDQGGILEIQNCTDSGCKITISFLPVKD
jgi:signal transduction histidine kinase